MKRQARDNSRSKIDPMDCRHVILKIRYIIKSQPLSFAQRIVADYLQAWWHLLQISMFNVIHDVGMALVTKSPAAVRQALIANTDRVLGLCADKRE
jgi:hypothetical protein